jgi:hypothetical protein
LNLPNKVPQLQVGETEYEKSGAKEAKLKELRVVNQCHMTYILKAIGNKIRTEYLLSQTQSEDKNNWIAELIERLNPDFLVVFLQIFRLTFYSFSCNIA